MPVHHVTVCHSSILSTDNLFLRFWKLEEFGTGESPMSPKKRIALKGFHDQHQQDSTGQFLVSLPKKHDAARFGEYRTRDVHRFLSVEQSLLAKGQLAEFNTVSRRNIWTWTMLSVNHLLTLTNLIRRYSPFQYMLSPRIPAQPPRSMRSLMRKHSSPLEFHSTTSCWSVPRCTLC